MLIKIFKCIGILIIWAVGLWVILYANKAWQVDCIIFIILFITTLDYSDFEFSYKGITLKWNRELSRDPIRHKQDIPQVRVSGADLDISRLLNSSEDMPDDEDEDED